MLSINAPFLDILPLQADLLIGDTFFNRLEGLYGLCLELALIACSWTLQTLHTRMELL